MTFKDFKFCDEINQGLDAMNFQEPTPVQEESIPLIMKGRDIISVAQTGTGKTAAYVLPVLDQVMKNGGGKTSALIIAPTRELAMQIDQQIEGFSYFTGASSIAIYGGGSGSSFEAEKTALKDGADIIVATPGRLLSHLNMDYVNIGGLDHFILDEADRMLDMGFADDLKRIAEYLPKKRQNIMFSATMPPKIRKLAKDIMNDPAEVNIAISQTAEGILQAAHLAYDGQKNGLLKYLLKDKDELNSIIVFTSRKSTVKELVRDLKKMNMDADGISSDLDQDQREEVLRRFKNKRLKILVATDIISRGIDIDSIDLVLNYDVPNDPEDYVHRVGRTARAKSTGVALTFIDPDGMRDFQKIEQLIGKSIPKLPNPPEIGEGPEYKVSDNRGRNFESKRNFKKGKNYRPKGNKNG